MNFFTRRTTMLALVLGLFFSVCMLGAHVAHASTGDTVSGYAWSSNIGWINLNSENDTDPATAGVQKSDTGFGVTIPAPVAPSTVSTVSGYAWSSNIGWISFNADAFSSTSPCPTKFNNQCQAYVDWSQKNTDGSVNIKGWARACSVFASGCSGVLKGGAASGTSLGGWDGFIALGGYSATDGVKIAADGTMSGYAWGSDVVGWVDFSGAKTTIDHTPPTVTLTANPNPVTNPGDSTTLTWTTTNNPTSCTASGGTTQWSVPAAKAITGGSQSGITILGTTTFTITCSNSTGSGSASVTVTTKNAPSCHDGVQDQDETGVDTGGSCENGGSCTPAQNNDPSNVPCYCAVPAHASDAACKNIGSCPPGQTKDPVTGQCKTTAGPTCSATDIKDPTNLPCYCTIPPAPASHKTTPQCIQYCTENPTACKKKPIYIER